MTEIKKQILEELEAELAKDDAKMKELQETIRGEMFAKSTVRGGLFSNAARDACDKRAEAAKKQKDAIEKASAWKREMLSKYR